MTSVVISISKSHHLLDHARQSDDKLLKRIDVLENENDVLREKLKLLQETVATKIHIPAELELTGKQEMVLAILLERPLVTKEAVMTYLYSTSGAGKVPEIKIVDVFICKVRNKLEKFLPECKISTKWGVGYYLDPNSRQYLRNFIESRKVAITGQSK